MSGEELSDFVKEPENTPGRHLGVLGMVAIGFFWVSGGGYGNETLIYNGPPVVVIGLILALPLFYCLPVSLIVAELSTALSADSGPTVWATRATNYRLGMHNAFWSMLAWLVDSAAYPVVAAEYVVSGSSYCVDPNSQLCYLVKSGFASSLVLVVTLLKLCGLEVIVKFSSMLAIGALIPPLCLVCGGFPHMNPSKWIATTGAPLHMLPLGSWILWLNSGFFGVGALAGQVKRPVRRTFLWSIMWLILITVTCILLPVLVSYSLDSDYTHYKQPGQFASLAGGLYGQWMKPCFQVGAVMSNIGLYNALMIQTEVSALYILRELFPDLIRSWTEKALIVLSGLLTMGLVWLDYNLLVQSSMLLFSLPTLLIFYSFCTLRRLEPKLPRPFKVPGGWLGVFLVCLCPVSLTLFNFALNLDPYQDGFIIRVSVFAGVITVGCVAMLLPGMPRRCRAQTERFQAQRDPLLAKGTSSESD